MTFGQAPFTGGGAGDRRPGGLTNEDARQFRNEMQRYTRDAEQLRRLLQSEKIDPKEIDALLRNLRQLSDDRVYKDVEELARLQAQVTDSAKRCEYDLRRRLEAKQGRSCSPAPTRCRSSSARWSSSTTARSRGARDRGGAGSKAARQEVSGQAAVACVPEQLP